MMFTRISFFSILICLQPWSLNAESLDASPSHPVMKNKTSVTLASISPEASSAAVGNFPTVGGSYGLEQFWNHFAPHEPMYFIGGWLSPNIKLQYSFRYRIFNPRASWASKHEWLKGFNLAYSQTSTWDVSDPQQYFFYDSSYRPEGFYYLESLPFIRVPEKWQLGLQAGVSHESNGVKNPDHRSLNSVYFRPTFTIAHSGNDLFWTISPRVNYYFLVDRNEDLADYRGYVDFRTAFGLRDSVQLAAIGRLGQHFDKGSVQLDLTYPLTKLLKGNIDIALEIQYFVGYGDTLLSYNRFSNILRGGIAIVR
ncbi:MAG: phospholipase A [Myxococcota bacterium]